MPLEIGLWRVDGKPSKLATTSIQLEARLEELIETDASYPFISLAPGASATKISLNRLSLSAV